jgi:hypothetical protein
MEAIQYRATAVSQIAHHRFVADRWWEASLQRIGAVKVGKQLGFCDPGDRALDDLSITHVPRKKK